MNLVASSCVAMGPCNQGSSSPALIAKCGQLFLQSSAGREKQHQHSVELKERTGSNDEEEADEER